MTVVEFFDKNSIENIVGALSQISKKIVFVGDSRKRIEKSIEDYLAVTRGRGLDVQFEYQIVNRNDLMNIVKALSSIAESEEKCAFDLSGGDDLYLVAVGMVYKMYPEKVMLHRFNVNNGTICDCDADGKVLASKSTEISVEENIRIYGGRVIFKNEKNQATIKWDFGEDFIGDIFRIWELCRKNPTEWNKQTTLLEGLCTHFRENGQTKVRFKTDDKNGFKKGLLLDFNRDYLIKDLAFSDNEASFEFKNEQVMRVLTKAGSALELIVTLAMKSLEDKEGKSLYNSILTGVLIDWDGVVPKDGPNVENEIDVLAMRGLVPVFVSCKNGQVMIDELYKLAQVAETFGGDYAKKILVVSQLEKMGERAKYVLARAEEMGIRVIENAEALSFEALAKELKI